MTPKKIASENLVLRQFFIHALGNFNEVNVIQNH
jgi:hypothetical protein